MPARRSSSPRRAISAPASGRSRGRAKRFTCKLRDGLSLSVTVEAGEEISAMKGLVQFLKSTARDLNNAVYDYVPGHTTLTLITSHTRNFTVRGWYKIQISFPDMTFDSYYHGLVSNRVHVVAGELRKLGEIADSLKSTSCGLSKFFKLAKSWDYILSQPKIPDC